MKSCNYCGRENQSDAAYCRECGSSEFAETLPPPLPKAQGVPDTKKPTAPCSPSVRAMLLIAGLILGLLSGTLTVGGAVVGFCMGRETQKAPEGFVYVGRGGDPKYGRKYSLTAPLIGILVAVGGLSLGLVVNFKGSGEIITRIRGSAPRGDPVTDQWLSAYVVFNGLAFIVGIILCIRALPTVFDM